MHKSVNYSQEYVRVTRTSTINVKRVMYTVPSRLVDSQVRCTSMTMSMMTT
jgi:hypothetical protein